MEGGTGKARWEHRGGDFLEAAENPHDSLTPQHHYRLDAESLEDTRHSDGCRDFRESVLAQLPHRWSSPGPLPEAPPRGQEGASGRGPAGPGGGGAPV